VVSVTVVNSGLPSDDRTIVIGLRNALEGARIDANDSTVSVIIMAHDHVAGLLGFNQTSINATEGCLYNTSLFTRYCKYTDGKRENNLTSLN